MRELKRRPRRIQALIVVLAGNATIALAQQPGGGRTAPAGTVDGVVTDTSLRPLAGATISIMGSRVRVVTGDNGRFSVSDLPAGQYILIAQRIGFEPLSERLQVSAADTARISFELNRAASALDTVVVRGNAVPAKVAEFETRRLKHEATASFDRDDILKVNPADTWQMLSRVSALKLVPFGKNGGLWAVSTRAMKLDGTSLTAVPCFMSVMIDGVMMAADPAPSGNIVGMTSRSGGDPTLARPQADGSFDMMNLPPPDQIHGIEVFAGPATIPPQYNGAANDKMCGLIAIWTR